MILSLLEIEGSYTVGKYESEKHNQSDMHSGNCGQKIMLVTKIPIQVAFHGLVTKLGIEVPKLRCNHAVDGPGQWVPQ